MTEPTDQQIFELIFVADDEALSEGKSPNQRSIHVMMKVMKALGYAGYQMFGVGTPPIVERIFRLHGSLYRDSDLAIGGFTRVYLCFETYSRDCTFQ